ncbi:MAG: M4 family metallopeptidase [Caldilineaceae bacterium]
MCSASLLTRPMAPAMTRRRSNGRWAKIPAAAPSATWPIPTIFDDPDRMLSSNYSCNETDQGGVHTNSGVNNKAAFLLTDGGTFNSHTITGLGLPKTAQLYYEALANHLTSGSSYADLADALVQASISLNFSAAEQQTVADVVDAVEMKLGLCNPPVEEPLCPAGQAAQLLFGTTWSTWTAATGARRRL